VKVELLYGREGKVVEFPDGRTTVVVPRPVDPVPDEKAAVRRALRAPIGSPPLRELVGPDDSVAIVFSDITRPMPSDRVLPVLLEELDDVPDDRIVFINALGTHRPNTPDELVDIVGPEIVERYRVIQHDCRDENELVCLGETSRGHEIWVSRTYMESTVRILTGFIEPHLFAGFSGGPKAVLPGVAGIKTITANHGPEMIGHPRSTFTYTRGNPIWEEMFEVAARTEPTFLLNVTLTEDRRITGVFGGDLEQAHEAGVAFVKRTAMLPVDRPFDIVVTTAGGYPLDISLYQSVKGIGVAANIVKDGGAIIMASECMEGLPDYGEYGELMRLAESPDALLAMIHQPGFMMQDQWDAQIQAQICKRVDVHIYSEGLTDEEIRQAQAVPCEDVESTVAVLLERSGPEARIAVLPAGALVVPYLQGAGRSVG
jgi:nickel-dependent lactate racemase